LTSADTGDSPPARADAAQRTDAPAQGDGSPAHGDSGAAAANSTTDKPTLRTQARRLRSASLTADEGGKRLSLTVARRIAASAEFQAATIVLTYLAFGSEVDLESLHKEHRGARPGSGAKRFAVPLTHAPDSQLTFHLLEGADLLMSRSGFREPLAAAPRVSLSDVDLVLVPGLAFDVKGTRLGYGKGFYDRFLAQLESVDPGVPTVGVTIDALVFEALPSDPHDVPVSHLVTESRFWRIER